MYKCTQLEQLITTQHVLLHHDVCTGEWAVLQARFAAQSAAYVPYVRSLTTQVHAELAGEA